MDSFIGDSGDVPNWWPNEPAAAVQPDSVAEIQQIVELASTEGFSILPAGSGSRIETGYAPSGARPLIQVKTARFDQLLDYQPDDLTVTCRPGMTLDSLQKILAQHGQFLPLDVPHPTKSTLGGIVASNAAGFYRPAYGAPRDLVIGLRVILADCSDVKGGGKVVKNVAGYDLCKLFTGSWGTLGFITEITFKVRPLPETRTAVKWAAPDLTTACLAGLAIHHARLAPTYILSTNELTSSCELITEMHGSPQRVEWQAEAFAKIAKEQGVNSSFEKLDRLQSGALNDLQARMDSSVQSAVTISCLPNSLVDLIGKLDAISSLKITVNCSSGIVNIAGTGGAEIIAAIESTLPDGTNRVWTKLPNDLAARDSIHVWGSPREEFFLHRAIKAALDPQNIFSPGRFLNRL